jgi:acetyl esterase/lipase
MMTRKAAKYLLLACLVVLSACARRFPDLSGLQAGGCYVAHYDDRDVVLLIEDVTRQSIKGRWYLENGYSAKPHQFVAGARRPGGMKSKEVAVKSDALPGDNTLVLHMKLDGAWHKLSFAPLKQPSTMALEGGFLYHDCLYNVDEETVVYAHAKGYWSTYPEPEYDCDDYLPIVKNKWLDDEAMTLKDLALDMDIYRPRTTDTKPRPLLMLIHGGAFFNGDKKSAGYPEWGRYFASRGYIVASINYRLGFGPYGAKHVDRAGYRAEQDARAAMSYLLRHPERYPIDRNYLFVAGSSAGGITSLNLAFMTNDDIPNSAKAGPVNEMVTDLRELLGTNNNQRRQVGLEDLGDINKVANDNGGKVDFTINAVVNMWGAVHKIEMIDHSQTTAILSFHGDADQVVPYGYDRPFSQKEPLNKLMCNKMYGSKCVHDRAKANGMQQELHTKAGAGHGLHADCGQLTDYFYYITENATRFFYLRIFPRPAVTMSREGKQQWFTLENAGEVQECRWEAVGGVVLEAEPDRVRAMFFNDKEEHTMRVVGQQKNGQSFVETYNVD